MTRYIAITPARDEEKYSGLIASMAAQKLDFTRPLDNYQ